MNTATIRDIIIERDNQKIINHSQYRKIIELIILVVFSAIGLGAIVVGSIFKEQSYFFRISLILIGIVIIILFFESFLTIITNRIILTTKTIKFRRYFLWKTIDLENIASFEIEKRSTRFSRDNVTPRYVNLIIISKINEPIYYSLTRFRTNEAYTIVETIKIHYQENKNKVLIELNSPEIDNQSNSISEQDISKQIPPKVEAFELEVD